MEIIYKGNKHNEPKPEQMYGCICENCASAFTFADHEVNKPPYLFVFDTNRFIKCPVCDKIITLNKCIKFKNDSSEEAIFKLKYKSLESICND